MCTVMFEKIYPNILLPHLAKAHAVWLIKSVSFFNFANHGRNKKNDEISWLGATLCVNLK